MPLRPAFFLPKEEKTMDLLNVTETSKIIRVSTATVRRLVSAGKFPHRRVGFRVFFTREDIETYLKSCAVPASELGSGNRQN
jgi:excisionase family DNA binding protein